MIRIEPNPPPPAPPALPDLGEALTGIRDYPERTSIIRSSQRVLISGLLSLVLPPLSWGFCLTTQREVRFASSRSLDPLCSRTTWPRQAALGLAAALATVSLGGLAGIASLVFLAVIEGCWVRHHYLHDRPKRWNPARSQLYTGAACANVARIQAFACLQTALILFASLLIEP